MKSPAATVNRWQVSLGGSVWEEHNHPDTTNLSVRMSAVKTLYCLEVFHTDIVTDSHCADRCHSHQRLQSHTQWLETRLELEIWDSWTIFTFYFGRINIKTNVWRLPREVCRNVRRQHLVSWSVCCRMHDGDATYVCIIWWWWSKVIRSEHQTPFILSTPTWMSLNLTEH